MLKILYLIAACLVCTSIINANIFDYKVITSVRHGIAKSLEYIDENYQRVNVDCLFGVVLTTAIINDAYQNGSHIMDNSSLRIMEKSFAILGKTLPIVPEQYIWLAHTILDYKIWQKSIDYQFDQIYPLAKIPRYHVLHQIFKDKGFRYRYPNTDFCFQDIANITSSKQQHTTCFISDYCSRMFTYDVESSGYILTHKLLLLQFARARKCEIGEQDYNIKTSQLCSLIFSEVLSGDFYDRLDEMFDLFLEEIVVCGYEGFAEFFRNKWLYYILKTQRLSGCFAPRLDDNLKTRIKRNTNIFEDGCADHTTGLGAAVLALHYNYIIKENMRR